MKKIIIVAGSVRKIGEVTSGTIKEWCARGYYLSGCSDIGEGKAKLIFEKVQGKLARKKG